MPTPKNLWFARQTNAALLTVAVLFLIGSCTKVSCKQAVLDSFAFYAVDSIPDTQIIVRTYEAATNFTRLVDSTVITGGALHRSGTHYNYIWAACSMESGYDYMIRLLPSGKIHKVSKINIGSDKIYGGQYRDNYCVSSWSCMTDDSLQSSPMEPNQNVQPYFAVNFKY